jgi:hypothetical protein
MGHTKLYAKKVIFVLSFLLREHERSSFVMSLFAIIL